MEDEKLNYMDDENLDYQVYKGDVKALASQLKEQESLLNLKRRWLMDLPLKVAEEDRIKELLCADRNMPESLLREEDVSYENIKTIIEAGFGAHEHGVEHFNVREEIQILKSPDDCRDLLLLLDGMTSKGLCSFVNVLTGGMVKFEKTNLIMKRVIKEHLGRFISDKSGTWEIKLKQLSELLNDPRNFHESLRAVPTISEAYCDAANKVLDGLEDFCSITLRAMKRKIDGVKGYIPALDLKRSQKKHLIHLLRKECKILLDLGKGGEPSERLASALGVVGLELTHVRNCPVAVNFRIFSREVKALQSDVAKAIWLLKEQPKRLCMIELRLVLTMLDPNAELSERSLSHKSLCIRVRNMLREYLFECGDMEEVPDSLIKTLDIINVKSLQFDKKKASSEIYLSPQDRVKEEMQREVEHVLAVSAQAKEVLMDWFPGHELDEDFATAYMEDFEESDTPFTCDDDEQRHCEFEFHDSQSQTSSIGETSPDKLNSHVSTSEADSCHARSPDGTLDEPTHVKKMDFDVTSGSDHLHSVKESEIHESGQHMDTEHNSSKRGTVKMEVVWPDPFEATTFARTPDKSACKKEEPTGFCTDTPIISKTPDFSSEGRNVYCHQNTSCNAYLEIQEACDTASMVAYTFVGRMLEELANIEGIELSQGDRSYLRSGAPVTEHSEEPHEALLTSKFPQLWKDVLEGYPCFK